MRSHPISPFHSQVDEHMDGNDFNEDEYFHLALVVLALPLQRSALDLAPNHLICSNSHIHLLHWVKRDALSPSTLLCLFPA